MDEHRLERKAQVAELLLSAARQFGEIIEPERVYDRFHELLADFVQHNGLVVSSYDERDGLIRCDYAWVDGNRLDPSIFPALELNRTGGGMQSRVIVSGEPLLVNDVADQVQSPGGTYYDVDRAGTMRKLPDSGPPGTRAAMMVPVKQGTAVVGVVQLMSDGHEYTREELELFEGLVGQMAAAVRTARLHKEQRRLEAAEAAARAVAAQREQAAHVLDAVGSGIFLVDRQGVVRLWNRSAQLVTGLRREQVLDRSLAEALPGWPELEKSIPLTGGGARPRSVTLPVEIRGHDLWLSFVAVEIAEGVVYAFRDLTGEHRLEEAKSEFIATISHELRTPMAAVYGAAETLLRRDLSGEQRRQLVEMIATQAARLSQITEQVLLATQLDREDVPVGREPVDVAELVRRSIETIRGQLPASASLEVDVAPGVGAASADADRVQQVLVNLLDNAIKYGDAPFSVHVEAANGVVRISVADSGPGIAFSEQRRIFEKFYRADPHLARAPGGTGLGLYISRELVRRMGGRLEVRSEPGAGATFVVELPRA